MIWLVGNKGMLGTDVEKELRSHGFSVIASDKEIDITDYATLKDYTADKTIEWIINCSAYTAVDKAEDEPEKAHAINGVGVGNLANIAKDHRSRLIHFSTDYVFGGDKGAPYVETDPAAPLGVYGKSKLKGEEMIKTIMREYFIIRLSWLFGIHGNNFVQTMIKLMKERDELRVVADQWGTPTSTLDVAKLIITIINSESTAYGVYHFSNEGKTSWHQFAVEIYRQAKGKGLVRENVSIVPITTDQYPTKAVRPKYSYLSKEKIKNEFPIVIPPWEEALRKYIELL